MKLYYSHTYKNDSYLPVTYSFDETYKAYHWVIAEQDFYVYSFDTPTCYLPNGYLGPTRIPDNDKDDVNAPEGDDARPSDVPPLFDNPITTNPSSSWPTCHCGSFTLSISIETYQQIKASQVAMDKCLIEI